MLSFEQQRDLDSTARSASWPHRGVRSHRGDAGRRLTHTSVRRWTWCAPIPCRSTHSNVTSVPRATDRPVPPSVSDVDICARHDCLHRLPCVYARTRSFVMLMLVLVSRVVSVLNLLMSSLRSAACRCAHSGSSKASKEFKTIISVSVFSENF